MSGQSGGPAFPGHYWCSIACRLESSGGMTLRDYFAGQALHDAARIAAERMNIASGNSFHEGIARCAYMIADAMLAKRAKP